MSGHTPGPWVAEGGSVSAHHAAGDSRLEYWICEEVNGDRRCNAKTGTPTANARLIAAAPDLLAAAKLAFANLHRNLLSEEACGQPAMGDDEHEAIRVLLAAIAKATGELA